MQTKRLLDRAGAAYAEIPAACVPFDPTVRRYCEENACGFYGRCYACPPDAGEGAALIAAAREYSYALVFRVAYPIEDEFDIDGMREAARKHNRLVRRLAHAFDRAGVPCLPLGAGACGGCKVCAKVRALPCRHPERCVLSLEACCVDAAGLARAADLLHGGGGATYFGLILYGGK